LPQPRLEHRLHEADVAWELLEQRFPSIARDLTNRGTRYQSRFIQHAAKIGRALMNPNSAKGAARRAAFYR
jgi:hypothetical protein